MLMTCIYIIPTFPIIILIILITLITLLIQYNNSSTLIIVFLLLNILSLIPVRWKLMVLSFLRLLFFQVCRVYLFIFTSLVCAACISCILRVITLHLRSLLALGLWAYLLLLFDFFLKCSISFHFISCWKSMLV